MSDLYTDEMVVATVGLGKGHAALNTMFDGWLCRCGHKASTDDEIDAHQVRVIIDAVAPTIAAKAWAEGHATPWVREMDDCRCGAWNRGECGCGLYGTGRLITPNPYEVKA